VLLCVVVVFPVGVNEEYMRLL